MPSAWFTAHVAPNPAVMPSGEIPTGMRATISVVLGSIRTTESSVKAAAQTEPNASTRSIGDLTAIEAITFAVEGSTRSSLFVW